MGGLLAVQVATDHSSMRSEAGARDTGLASSPVRVARPAHLETTYRAPLVPAPAIGRLRVPQRGIDAAVVSAGWDHETMAVPNDVTTVGWFEPSAQRADLAGVSLIAGHVADPVGRPGALAGLDQVQEDDIVEWSDVGGETSRFKVTGLARYPRARGLPPSLFNVAGPHTLQLVTCANRQDRAGGFHYVDNLVVTAVQIA